MARIDSMIERLTEPDAISEYRRQIALDSERSLASYHRDKAKYAPQTPRRLEQRRSQIKLRRHFLSLGIPCQHCGSRGQLEVSHKLAVNDGGGDSLDNVEWLCHSCHIAYANPSFITEWLA